MHGNYLENHGEGVDWLRRSLHVKLVLIMVLLVIALMTVAGAFLINSVGRFYLKEFYTQMADFFAVDAESWRDLEEAKEGETDPVSSIEGYLASNMGILGVDGRNRNYYIRCYRFLYRSKWSRLFS